MHALNAVTLSNKPTRYSVSILTGSVIAMGEFASHSQSGCFYEVASKHTVPSNYYNLTTVYTCTTIFVACAGQLMHRQNAITSTQCTVRVHVGEVDTPTVYTQCVCTVANVFVLLHTYVHTLRLVHYVSTRLATL